MKKKILLANEIERILERFGFSKFHFCSKFLIPGYMVIDSRSLFFSFLIKLRKDDEDGFFVVFMGRSCLGANIMSNLVQLGEYENELRAGGLNAFVAESYSAEIEGSVFYVFVPIS